MPNLIIANFEVRQANQKTGHHKSSLLEFEKVGAQDASVKTVTLKLQVLTSVYNFFPKRSR